MEIKVINETENSLFNRKEITASVEAESSPRREEVIQELAKKYSTELDNIKIKGVRGSFGSSEFKIEANIYSSKKERDNVEGKKKKDEEIEKKRAEAQKAAEQPAESSEQSGEPSEEEKKESKEEKSEEKNQ